MQGSLGLLIAGFLTLGAVPGQAQVTPLATIPSPTSYFGHQMGADRRLVHYDEAIPYYELLARDSDRVELFRIGKTTAGRDLIMLAVSTPGNLARADRYREIAARLDDPRGLSPAEIDTLVGEGKVIVLVSLNIHSSEIASSQTGIEWVYDLATGDSRSVARHLEDVILLVIPSVNPDGQALITEWYRKYLGTRYEGGDMPWLYHTYAGHDNNRDWFMLNLPETRAVNRVAYHEWFPQIIVDEHQMGNTGPRAFVPPYTDPVSDKVHPLIHRSATLIGANMAMDLEQRRKSGVIYGYSFDAYWPGGTRSTPWWKNTVGILIEIASARVASPIYVDPGELSGGRKGLPDYQAQVNFPNPWPGGWWRMRDIVEYQLIVSNSALRTAALHREDFLRNRATMAQDAIQGGETEEPYGYVISPRQHDPGAAAKLVDLLLENGLEVYFAPTDLISGSQVIPAGAYVIPSAQPYRSFLVELMEPQTYPRVRVGPKTDEIFLPYDVTAWTLPYLMGVRTTTLGSPMLRTLERIESSRFRGPEIAEGTGNHWALSPAETDAYGVVNRLLDRGIPVFQTQEGFPDEGTLWPPGTFLTPATRAQIETAAAGFRVRIRPVTRPKSPVPGATESASSTEGPVVPMRTLSRPRIGIYQSWLASMDEGWTRCVLDQFGFTLVPLHNREIQDGNLTRSYDAIIIPDMNRRELVEGTWGNGNRFEEPRPKPYEGGLGPTGVQALARFVRKGGTLITFGDAAELAIEDLNIPVQNQTKNLSTDEFSTPGTVLRVTVDPTHPLGYGMPDHALVYHTTNPVLGTHLPGPGGERDVIARFESMEDVVASGWAVGADRLERKAALVEVSVGEGHVVLFGFRPQHRAQTHATYRMIFNSMLDAAVR